MSAEFLAALLGSIAKIGLEATLIIMEKMNKPAATIDDAIAACKAAQAKTLADFKAEA